MIKPRLFHPLFQQRLKMPAPVSAPSSPLASRHPITPQRISYSSQKTFKHALQQQSPVTPYSLSSTSSWSTPFTPLSANSSNITTPGSSQADNWRKRASQNGIRVKEASNNKNLVTDDNEDASKSCRAKCSAYSSLNKTGSDVTNPYDEVELPQYRPLHSMPFNTNHLATPPQNARLLSALKRKGVTTAPAPVPHRPFIPSAAYNNSLFDIAEDNSVSYPFELPHASPLAFFSPQVQRRGTGFADVFEFHDQQTFIPDSPMLPASPTACSVCATTSTATLAVLQPCAHALCSACLTSALNIVGEKDMECVACSSVVADFKLVPKAQANSENENSATHVQTNQSSGDEEAFWCGARSSSTPAPVEERPEENTATDQGLTKDPPTVLRIDNVPWSITPPLLTAFLSPPPQRAHVLLSPEGKTLSHAFVEYDSHSEGLAALASARNRIIEGSQGEVRQPSIKGNAGRRRRGVTVTVAGRGELMRALFPSWQGAFDERNRPSLMGLDNYAVRRALEGGLMTPRDMRGLKRLIESPNVRIFLLSHVARQGSDRSFQCHFVKVPTLPFFCLISLLQRFPSDQDSCVFWSHALRDDLFG